MWKLFLGCIIIWMCQGVQAQTTTAPADSIPVEEAPPKIPLKMLLEGKGIYHRSISKMNFSGGAGAGLMLNQWTAGVYWLQFLGEIKRTLVFPAEFELINTQRGAYIGRRFRHTNKLYTEARFSYGIGEILWQRADESFFASDRYRVIMPEIQLAFEPLPQVEIFGSLAYAHNQSLKLPYIDGDLSEKSFSGVCAGMGIKLTLISRP